MKIRSINPATEQLNGEFETLYWPSANKAAKDSRAAFEEWKMLDVNTLAGTSVPAVAGSGNPGVTTTMPQSPIPSRAAPTVITTITSTAGTTTSTTSIALPITIPVNIPMAGGS